MRFPTTILPLLVFSLPTMIYSQTLNSDGTEIVVDEEPLPPAVAQTTSVALLVPAVETTTDAVSLPVVEPRADTASPALTETTATSGAVPLPTTLNDTMPDVIKFITNDTVLREKLLKCMPIIPNCQTSGISPFLDDVRRALVRIGERPGECVQTNGRGSRCTDLDRSVTAVIAICGPKGAKIPCSRIPEYLGTPFKEENCSLAGLCADTYGEYMMKRVGGFFNITGAEKTRLVVYHHFPSLFG